MARIEAAHRRVRVIHSKRMIALLHMHYIVQWEWILTGEDYTCTAD